MNNYDIYEQLKGKPIERAKFALQVAKGKASKYGAWEWADKAIFAADINPAVAGGGSYPNLEALERAIISKEKGLDWTQQLANLTQDELITMVSAAMGVISTCTTPNDFTKFTQTGIFEYLLGSIKK